MGRLRFGCAGYSYKEWVGPFYESQERMLAQYAQTFDTVEVDSTFYSFPQPGTILGMTRYTPNQFVFSAKLNRLFTHDLRMKLDENGVGKLDEFCQLLDPLLTREKLGCVLIQLPPSQRADHALLEDFLSKLPHRFDWVIEFRHKSWMQPKTWLVLDQYSCAYCIVDEPLLPPEVHVTSKLGYIRWHGHGANPWYDYRYSDEQLQDWVPRVKEVADNTEKLIGIFNNHFHGYAPENCLEIMQMLGIAEPKHVEKLKRVQAFIDRGEVASVSLPGSTTLDQYVGLRQPVAKMLARLTHARRLERAKETLDMELIKNSDGILQAKVREYDVHVSLPERTIEHDCSDWKRVAPENKFCKHLAAVFIKLPEDDARVFLQDLLENSSRWQFIVKKQEIE